MVDILFLLIFISLLFLYFISAQGNNSPRRIGAILQQERNGDWKRNKWLISIRFRSAIAVMNNYAEQTVFGFTLLRIIGVLLVHVLYQHSLSSLEISALNILITRREINQKLSGLLSCDTAHQGENGTLVNERPLTKRTHGGQRFHKQYFCLSG